MGTELATWKSDDKKHITLHASKDFPEKIKKMGAFYFVHPIPANCADPAGSWIDGHDELEFKCNSCDFNTTELAKMMGHEAHS